jgi:DNA-binding NarL/FixJ family response regulator
VSHHLVLGPKDVVTPAAPRPALSLAATATPLMALDGDPVVHPDGQHPDGRHRGSACISVGNSMVGAALSVTAQRQGWSLLPAPAPGSVLITDVVPSATIGEQAAAVVLVSEPTPFGARRALDAVAALQVTAVVCADEPGDLQAALACLAEDRGSIPRRVGSLAARMPEVNPRQVALLGAVLAGQTTAQMARGLHLSSASVKRELGTLSRTLRVTTRAALFARALELGVQPAPLSA